MQVSYRTKLILAAIPLAVLPFTLRGNSEGANVRVTGAPGDDPMACTQCHTGNLNSGSGSVRITTVDSTYTPGVVQRIKVTVADPAARRWGFELSPRVASSPAAGRAGTLTSVDDRTQVKCDGEEAGTPAPCADANTIEFITHTSRGTRIGTTGSAEFEFDWTPPATDVGTVTLYVAGNAANASQSETGDRIYTSKADLTPVAVVTQPTISSERGVLNAATSQAPLSAQTWITINGTGLAGSPAVWDAEKFEERKLPTSLSGVSVTVNGKNAYIQSVSAAKIMALTPAGDAQGEVEVVVTNAGQTSAAAKVKLEPFAPGVFTHDGKHVILTRGEDKPVDRPEQIPAKDKDPATAKPGEKITLYATGLGATNPATPEGVTADTEAPLSAPLTVTIGGVDVTAEFVGIRPGSAAIYRIVLTVPESLEEGEHKVNLLVQDVKTPEAEGCCFLVVKKAAAPESVPPETAPPATPEGGEGTPTP